MRPIVSVTARPLPITPVIPDVLINFRDLVLDHLPDPAVHLIHPDRIRDQDPAPRDHFWPSMTLPYPQNLFWPSKTHPITLKGKNRISHPVLPILEFPLKRIRKPATMTLIRRKVQKATVRRLDRPPHQGRIAPNPHEGMIDPVPDRLPDRLKKEWQNASTVANPATLPGTVVAKTSNDTPVDRPVKRDAATKGRTARENPGGVEM